MTIKHLSQASLLVFLVAIIGGCNSCSKSPACSGHGTRVEENGMVLCDCAQGYHMEGLTCVQNVQTCVEACEVDDDCRQGSGYTINIGYSCSNRRCIQCTEDNQCIAHLSGWWDLEDNCSSDDDCSASPSKKCLKVAEGEGRCINVAQDCSNMPYGYTLVSKPDINGTDSINVCAVTNVKCLSGKCYSKECDTNTDCVAKISYWLARCSTQADCDSSGLSMPSACIYLAPNEAHGYCAGKADSGCLQLPNVSESSLPRFEDRDSTVSVCMDLHALSDATCNNGRCANPCKDDTHCQYYYETQTLSCDTNTGKCLCKKDLECKTDYASKNSANKCLSGYCGCSDVDFCQAEAATLLNHITWECTTH